MKPALRAWWLPCAACALAAGILVGRAASALWYGLLAMALCTVACFLTRGWLRFAATLLLTAALGCSIGFSAYHPTLPVEGDYWVTGVITQEIRFEESGQVKTVLRDVTLNGVPFSGGAYWTYYTEEPPADLTPGMRVTLTARLYHPEGEVNPGGFNFREHLLAQNVTIGLYGCDDLTAAPCGFHLHGIAAALRSDLTNRLVAVMGEESGAYAAAMLLGNQTLLPTDDRAAFSALGIAHILAVSGYHVGVLASLLAFLLRRLHVSRLLRLILTGILLAAYCLLTGLHAPVLRAAIMYLCYETGALLHRPRSRLHMTAASMALILLTSPAQLTSAGFQLSYAAIIGLTLFSDGFIRLHTFRRKWVQTLWQGLCLSLAAQIGLLLPELYWYQSLPLMGVLLNVPVILLGSGLMTLYWLVLTLLPITPLAEIVGSVARLVTEGLLSIVRALGEMHFVSLWTKQPSLLTAAGWLLLASGLCMLWRPVHIKRKHLLSAGAALVTLSLIPMPHTQSEYIQFSVDNADTALLWDRNCVLVVDTGDDGLALSTYLRQQRLSVDMLILTHLHADHAGGIRSLLDDGIPVRTCYLPVGAQTMLVEPETLLLLEELRAQGTEFKTLGRGDTLPLPSGEITVLWPEHGRVRPMQEANDYSLVMAMRVKGTTLLLTGDISGTYEHYAATPADILKVAHHGSNSSTLPPFLSAVSPQTLLLSCGRSARTDTFRARTGDIPLYITERAGAIRILFDDTGYTISTTK